MKIKTLLLSSVLLLTGCTSGSSLLGGTSTGSTTESLTSALLGSVTGTSSSSTSSTGASLLGSLIGNLLGTSSVSSNTIVGTWSYQGSAVVFESENVLAQLGGTLASSSVESKINQVLTKAGFTAGRVVLTLNQDNSYTLAVNGKNTTGTWQVSGSTLTLSPSIASALTSKANISFNVSLSGNTLQLAIQADKILDLLKSASNIASSVSSSLSTVTSLLSNYNGVQLGLKFTR